MVYKNDDPFIHLNKNRKKKKKFDNIDENIEENTIFFLLNFQNVLKFLKTGTRQSINQSIMTEVKIDPYITFFQKIHEMRDMCIIKDAQYWNIEFKKDEKPTEIIKTMETMENKGETSYYQASDKEEKDVLDIITDDGFTIRLRFLFDPPFRCHFNGYVTLPRHLHVNSSIIQEMDYMDLKIDLTYWNKIESKYGWDHGHTWDAKLCVSQSSQGRKYVSGPVQVLEEARSFIDAIRTKHNEIIKEKKRLEMEMIREELMMNACHPRRMAKWIEHDFEPF